MESVKFGKGPFQIGPVINFLRGSERSYKLICEVWEEFGYNLGLDEREIEHLRDELSSGNSDLWNMPREILRVWKHGHGDHANLDVLYQALKDINLRDVAGSIREKFDTTRSALSASNPEGPLPPKTLEQMKKETENLKDSEDENDSESVDLNTNVGPPPSKRLKPTEPENSQDDAETIDLNVNDSDLNVPDEDGDFPLLLAIREGQSVASIGKLLKDGADVNIKSNDGIEDNAAHEVIRSLIDKTRDRESALYMSNLLVVNGFNLINEADSKGFTPLLYATQYEDLDEKLLNWFFTHGADFNAAETEDEDSVLFRAICERQSAAIICKILDFGGDAKHLNKTRRNALHMAAKYGHESALKMFIDYMINVNEEDGDECTPLHLLFSETDVDYLPCLKLLLRKGADFNKKCKEGYVPLVKWMKYGDGNPFPTIKKISDRLPITGEIASETLTAIVEVMESLQQYLPSSSREATNEFTQFITFLTEEKKAKLKLENEDQWKQENWQVLDKVLLKPSFLKVLKNVGSLVWNGEFNRIKASALGMFDFYSTSSSIVVFVPVEVALVSLLACRNYKGFVEVCQFIEKFCRT